MFRLSRTARRAKPTWEPASVLECPLCHRDRVCPVDWGTSGDDHWWLLLRCPDCDVWIEVVITNSQAAALDVVLDRQQAQIARAADALDAERMHAEADAFIRALRLGLVDAADFGALST